jgi:two-component system capsular synthesis sensor histidine kinase RcsC
MMLIAKAENMLRPLHQEPDDPLQPAANPRPDLVLVIEDDKPVREMFRRFLLFAGFEVLVAAGGREGVTLLQNEPRIAVVMLDLNMPYMDGRQVRAAQLASDRLARIPTVIVTALQLTQADRDQLQASDYLAKPVNLERLEQVIGRYCASAIG